MITFHRVTDRPASLHVDAPVLLNASAIIPAGRYALLATDNAVRRPVLDLITGSRAPARGRVNRQGLSSWAIGRGAFIRGRSTGEQLVRMIARLYHLDGRLCEGVVRDMLTSPERLPEPIERWDSASRQEFGHVLALLPSFDIYVIDGAIPSRKGSFTSLWNVLVRQRIMGKTLILSTVRAPEAMEFCDKALIVDNGRIRISEELEQALADYPPRPFLDGSDGSGRAPETVIIDDL